MLPWFAVHPEVYWWMVIAATAAVMFPLVRPLRNPGWQDTKGTDWRWALVILLLLGMGRWPTWLVTRQFNEDESQLLAGAITLRHDPVFWRSVDGDTAGPVDFFALLPVGSLHGADDFASARLTALLLLAAALIFAHQTIAIAFGRQAARVATFGAVWMESCTLNLDLLHYSTELAPITLLAFACWAGARRFLAAGSWKWNLAGGAALGLIPFAKLQAAPMGLVLGLGWLAAEVWVRHESPPRPARNITVLIGAALAPLGLAVLVLTVTGQTQNAIIPYILHNVAYVNNAEYEKVASVHELMESAGQPGTLIRGWLIACGIGLLLLPALLRGATMPQRWAAAAAGSFLVSSLACVLIPHRPFLHYVQFLVVPGTLVLGVATGLALQSAANRPVNWRRILLGGILLGSAGPMLADRARVFHPYVGHLVKYQARPQGLVALELKKYAQPGEALGLWGWLNSSFSETGLRQAVRSGNSQGEIMPGRYREYYRERYLADLRASAPPLFIDTISPFTFPFYSPTSRHEQSFPELGAYIDEHYTLVAQPLGNRIYVRNDRVPPKP